MSNDVVISVENLWKQYRYGIISHRTLHKDLQSWWARRRGKPDPNTRISDEQSAMSKAQRAKRKAKKSDAMPHALCLMVLRYALSSLLMTLCPLRYALCQMLTTDFGPSATFLSR